MHPSGVSPLAARRDRRRRDPRGRRGPGPAARGALTPPARAAGRHRRAATGRRVVHDMVAVRGSGAGRPGRRALAGGKGANLGELVRAGLPVPPGFVVTTEAYRARLATGRSTTGVRAAGPDRVRGARAAAGGRALVGDRGGPRRRQLRRAAGHLPQRPRRRRAPRRRPPVLGLAGNERAVAYRGSGRGRRDGGDGGRRAGDGRGRRRRRALHREPRQRPAPGDRHLGGVGARGGRRRRPRRPRRGRGPAPDGRCCRGRRPTRRP